jgi:hypothetical protein
VTNSPASAGGTAPEIAASRSRDGSAHQTAWDRQRSAGAIRPGTTVPSASDWAFCGGAVARKGLHLRLWFEMVRSL